ARAGVADGTPRVGGPPAARFAPGAAVWILPVRAGRAGPAACFPTICPEPPRANEAGLCTDFFGRGVICDPLLRRQPVGLAAPLAVFGEQVIDQRAEWAVVLGSDPGGVAL